jgi:hypothetical protein
MMAAFLMQPAPCGFLFTSSNTSSVASPSIFHRLLILSVATGQSNWRSLPGHLITLSARASTFGGILTIFDFGFPILDCRIIG